VLARLPACRQAGIPQLAALLPACPRLPSGKLEFSPKINRGFWEYLEEAIIFKLF